MLHFILILLSFICFSKAWAQAPTPPPPEPLSPWSIKLTATVRSTDFFQYNLEDRRTSTYLRLRPFITFTGIEGLKVVMEPQYAKVLGAPSNETKSSSSNETIESSGNSSYPGSLDGLAMRNGYLDISLVENWNLIIGRQVLSYGDQYIISPADSSVYSRSFDAIRFRYAEGKNGVDFFQAKILENTIKNSQAGGDKELTGVYSSFQVSEVLKTWEAYGFYLADSQSQTNTTPAADSTRPWFFGVYGSRLVTEWGPFTWKLEAAQNFGNENSSAMGENNNNSMLDTFLDYKVDEAGKTRWGLQFFSGGKNWRELYPTTSKPLGLTDVLGRRNTTGLALHGNQIWSERFATEQILYAFQRTSTDAPAYLNDSKTSLGKEIHPSSDLGQELDLAFKFLPRPNFQVVWGSNFFLLGAYLRDSVNQEPRSPQYHYLLIEGKY